MPVFCSIQPHSLTSRHRVCDGLAISRRFAYLAVMSEVDFMAGADFPAPRSETAEEKEQRLAREAVMIAEARASVAAGRVVSLEAVTAWVDSWDTENELPPPHLGL
jgi:hypothetical protein